MFGNFGQLADLMRNAGKIREAMEKAGETLGQIEAEGSAGGDAVVARVNGRQELLALKIDPRLVADGDVELLEDMVQSAVNQALTKAREAAAKSITQLTGDLPLPNIPGFGA